MSTQKGSTKNRANNGKRDLSGTVFGKMKLFRRFSWHVPQKDRKFSCKRWETTRTSHVVSELELLYFLDALSCLVKDPWSPQKSSHTSILPVESQIKSNNEYLCKYSLNWKFLWISLMQFLEMYTLFDTIRMTHLLSSYFGKLRFGPIWVRNQLKARNPSTFSYQRLLSWSHQIDQQRERKILQNILKHAKDDLLKLLFYVKFLFSNMPSNTCFHQKLLKRAIFGHLLSFVCTRSKLQQTRLPENATFFLPLVLNTWPNRSLELSSQYSLVWDWPRVCADQFRT